MSKYLFVILLILISIFIFFIISQIEIFNKEGFDVKCQYCCNMLVNRDPENCAKNCIINGVKCECCY
jgi:hypothetical protein